MGLPYNNNARFDNLTPQFAIPSSTVVYNLLSSQTANQRTTIYTEGAGDGSGSIILPLPVNFNYKKYFQWQSKDHDFLQNKMAAGLAHAANKLSTMNTGNAMDVLKGLGGDAMRAITDTIQAGVNISSQEGTDAAIYLIQKKYGKDVADNVSQMRGQALNPLRKLYFQGMDLRTFDFSFDIVPQNSKESDDFLQAYRQLRVAATPIIDSNKIYYQYPSKFTVVISAGRKNLFSMSKLCCVNAGLNINEMKFRNDGNPMVYNLSLTFQESELADKDSERSSGLML